MCITVLTTNYLKMVDDDVDYSGLSVPILKLMAKELSIKPKSTKKSVLLRAIKQADPSAVAHACTIVIGRTKSAAALESHEESTQINQSDVDKEISKSSPVDGATADDDDEEVATVKKWMDEAPEGTANLFGEGWNAANFKKIMNSGKEKTPEWLQIITRSIHKMRAKRQTEIVARNLRASVYVLNWVEGWPQQVPDEQERGTKNASSSESSDSCDIGSDIEENKTEDNGNVDDGAVGVAMDTSAAAADGEDMDSTSPAAATEQPEVVGVTAELAGSGTKHKAAYDVVTELLSPTTILTPGCYYPIAQDLVDKVIDQIKFTTVVGLKQWLQDNGTDPKVLKGVNKAGLVDEVYALCTQENLGAAVKKLKAVYNKTTRASFTQTQWVPSQYNW